MKKSLVLTMAMALGVTASAYAANPFSDVPAGHWAYGSIGKLAAAGVIDGYGDSTFGGDKLMTRYEMAQIIAKAMAKGANVDKLAAEFADELDTLGVRVANLEKKSDNVKITGEVRASYRDDDGRWHEPDVDAIIPSNGNKAHNASLRTRLWVTGQVNDDWTYTGMLQNERTISGGNTADNDKLELNRAYVDGKVGGLAVRAGRWNEVPFSGNVLDSYLDGVKVAYGDKVQLFGLVGKAAAEEYLFESGDRVYVVGAEAKLGAVDTYLGYFKTDNINKQEIWNVGLSYGFGDFTLAGEYMRGDYDAVTVEDAFDKDGWAADLAWKGAEASAPGSYGLHVGYFDINRPAYLAPTTDAMTFLDGYKGWVVGGSYAFAKNIVGVVNYYDTESQTFDANAKTIFSELYFTF